MCRTVFLSAPLGWHELYNNPNHDVFFLKRKLFLLLSVTQCFWTPVFLGCYQMVKRTSRFRLELVMARAAATVAPTQQLAFLSLAYWPQTGAATFNSALVAALGLPLATVAGSVPPLSLKGQKCIFQARSALCRGSVPRHLSIPQSLHTSMRAPQCMVTRRDITLCSQNQTSVQKSHDNVLCLNHSSSLHSPRCATGFHATRTWPWDDLCWAS